MLYPKDLYQTFKLNDRLRLRGADVFKKIYKHIYKPLTLYTVSPPFHAPVISANTTLHALPVSAITIFYDPGIACI